MSMLAEPKRKIKWSLNPRGALWANDDAKYGQKLLEKMGWKKGKGLGKLENGRIEHIKVTYKNDSKGIGCNDKNENWIAHQDEFNAILSGLNQQHSVENIGNSDGIRPLKNFSLELKSRTSRSRVHYQKFVRGKDLSQYREEDMNSIFGTKSCKVLSSSMKIPNAERSKPSAEEKEESELNNFNGVATYKSAKTMSDYFSEKMKKIKQVHLFENNNITSEKILSNCEVDNENFLQKKSVEKKKWKEQKKNSEEIVASHVKAVTPSFDDQVSEIIVRHSDSPDTSNLKKSVPSKSSQISIHHQQKCNSFSDLSAHDGKCKMADGNSIQETNAAMKERKKKKHRPLKFSEADNDSISNLSVSHEIIPEISATNNDLKNAVVSDNKTKNDRKNMLEKDSHEIIVITSSRKRKCVSCSSSESLGSSKKKRKNDLKRCSADKLKSCLKECVVNGLKKIKKKVTFNEKLEFFKEKVSDESDTSNNIEIEDHANKEKNVFNEQGSELKGHNTQLQTSDIHDRLTIQLKDYENSTKTCSASDSENMLMTYLSTTVNGSPRLNNEPWVASQKLAMKLSHYQGMLKDLKSNKSLSTSNLLDIRGYGNW